MARNSHPEETVQKIVDIGLKLFRRQGYENTTIQDIVDTLGMSKGAIYHHFKSKEDILEHIVSQFYCDEGWFEAIKADSSLTGLEKLRKVFLYQLSDQQKLEVDHLSIGLLDNPKMLVANLRSALSSGAPMLAEFITQGVADGSLHVAQPQEMAEVLLVLTNLWIGGFATGAADFARKAHFLKDMTDAMGLPIFDQTLMAVCDQYFDAVISHR